MRVTGKGPGLVLMGLLSAAACGGSSTPTGPSGSGGPPGGQQVCRSYATSATYATTGQGFSSTINQTCSFNRTAFLATCTGQYSDNFGTSSTSTSTINYPSVADFVAEVQVVPPLTKSTGTSSTTTGSAGASASSSSHTYDAQGRLTRITGQSAAGTVTTTYTQWDGAGRPTRGSDAGSGVSNTLVIVYDDAARTRSTTFAGSTGLTVVTVETFDANGNPTRQTTSGPTSGATTAITVNATEQVCR